MWSTGNTWFVWRDSVELSDVELFVAEALNLSSVHRVADAGDQRASLHLYMDNYIFEGSYKSSSCCLSVLPTFIFSLYAFISVAG